jgi:hypothetical protein
MNSNKDFITGSRYGDLGDASLQVDKRKIIETYQNFSRDFVFWWTRDKYNSVVESFLPQF